jgi:hypothetical protein
MRESRTYRSARGARGNSRPYREVLEGLFLAHCVRHQSLSLRRLSGLSGHAQPVRPDPVRDPWPICDIGDLLEQAYWLTTTRAAFRKFPSCSSFVTA